MQHSGIKGSSSVSPISFYYIGATLADPIYSSINSLPSISLHFIEATLAVTAASAPFPALLIIPKPAGKIGIAVPTTSYAKPMPLSMLGSWL